MLARVGWRFVQRRFIYAVLSILLEVLVRCGDTGRRQFRCQGRGELARKFWGELLESSGCHS
jgi:hypothetical protein